MGFRDLAVHGRTAFLTWSSVPARPAVLGLVIEANRAHLNATAITPGATVYDGDRYTTEMRGTVRLQKGTTMVRLGEESVMTVRSEPNSREGVQAELDLGTLVFSAKRASALEVVASNAHVRPAADMPTSAQVSVMGPKELWLRVLRGTVELSYRGETEAIPDGVASRVILDPAENEAKKDQKGPVNDRKKKAFILISLAGVPALIYGLHKGFEYESPERP